MIIRMFNGDYSIFKVNEIESRLLTEKFVFIAKTDEELSVVCDSKNLFDYTHKSEKTYTLFRIDQILDFSLIGIISKLSNILAENGISIFVVSTFNTDYFLIQKDDTNVSISILEKSGYEIKRNSV